MRIAVDFKVLSTDAAMRGMGRYTQQQVREVLQLDRGVEIFLLMHGQIDKSSMLHDWISESRVQIVPVSVDGYDLSLSQLSSFDALLEYSHRLQTLLKSFKN
ncbi:hypothetical protein [Microvirga guangxiensis]|uniref:hypothetical protein n=1 Tax=Microvirga guangxiensis TaxID=549386 RepID=UPI0011133D95|nr:hypothetical protein [Microvirga guangxiensis]